jgi:fibro-slime domain-containing protein
MSMDLFVQKKSVLLTLTFAVSCWLAGCSASTAAPPPGGSTPGNGNGGSGAAGGVNGAGQTGYVFSTGGSNGGGSGTGKCAGTGKCFAPPVDAGPYCGDGILQKDLGEDCDDNNRIGGDGCSGICKVEPNWKCDTPGQPCESLVKCGNGIRQTGEGCDDGNNASGDGCDGKCNPESGYYCVPADTADPTSKSVCKKLASCGDGHITAGENCDLGAGNGPGTGCNNCQTEDGWVCRPGVGCKHLSVCGNSKVEDGEQCDDGNKDPDDGCSANCQIEASYYKCPTPGALCTDTSVCGNGILEKTEQCDDGNAEPDDGCTSTCTVEDGYQCRMAGQHCVPLCGDNMLVGGETCDDGNKDNGDGCSITCSQEPGYTCTGTGANSCKASVCGGPGATKDASEACDCGDDPNNLPSGCAGPNGLFFGDGTGCSKTCTKEPICKRNDTAGCASVCGDGNVSGTEKCDDGNTFDGDGCKADCSGTEEGFDCNNVTISDEQDCPSAPSLKCLVLPVVYRDFEGQNVTGGHPDFFYMGAAVSNGRTVGVTSGASKTTCMPNAYGTALTFTAGSQCPANDQSGPCTGLVANTLDTAGKPTMAKQKCHCIFTDWDNTGVLGTCSGATCSGGITGAQACWVDSSGDNHYRIEADVNVFQSAESFKQWYTDSDFSNRIVGTLELAKSGNVYQFSSSRPGDPAGSASRTRYDDIHEACLKTGQHSGTLDSGFFPLDDEGGTKICNITSYWMSAVASATDSTCCASSSGCAVKAQFDPLASWDNCPTEGTGGMVPKSDGTSGKLTGVRHNFYFTTEVRYLFRYDGKNATLSFNGDDDVWAFVNGILAIDLGGTHERATKDLAINATTYKLTSGNTYEIAVFQAERGPVESNYQLTLSGFSTVRTQCGATCGDGKVTGGEECDKPLDKAGKPTPNDGRYDGCNADCTYGPFCGDGVPNGDEECDDGKNTTVTSSGPNSDACGPGCKLPPRCGDGITQSGEECDAGPDNTSAQCGGCSESCVRNPYCGDGVIDDGQTSLTGHGPDCGETCDDGVNIGGYGYCLADCSPDARCGDGVTQTEFGETCDNGEQNSDAAGSACNTRCGIPAVCGDGSVQAPEQCDYGAENNTGAYGGCNVDCTLAAYCGDGVKNGTEQCDYGSANIKHGDPQPYGSCLDSCTLGPHCGDNVVQTPPEQCDQGVNNGPNNQCSDKCIVQSGIS